MKRSPLVRKTALKRGGELKRTPMERSAVPIPKVNKPRAAKARLRDFGGPYGKVLLPRLPCAICFPWFYARSDDDIRYDMLEVLAEPQRFAVVSEPAHFEHSRGAGGTAEDLCALCCDCHDRQHSAGVETFAAAHPSNDLPSLAARLWRLYQTLNVSEDSE